MLILLLAGVSTVAVAGGKRRRPKPTPLSRAPHLGNGKYFLISQHDVRSGSLVTLTVPL